MAKSRFQILSLSGKILAGFGAILLFLSFITCIIWGSIGAARYVKNRNSQNALTNTTCLLLNYTSLKHECTTCTGDSCQSYSCFDERFQFWYSIANETQIMSVLACADQKKPYKQTEVGTYSLFRAPAQTVSLFFHLDWSKLHVSLS